MLINPVDATNADSTLKAIEPVARALGLQTQVLSASTSREIDAAFAIIGRDRPDVIFVAQTSFLNGRRVQLAQLAAHAWSLPHMRGANFPKLAD